jgi:hypothetical protein
MSLGNNCKLKQGDATIHLLKWLKSRTLTPPLEQQELSFIGESHS